MMDPIAPARMLEARVRAHAARMPGQIAVATPTLSLTWAELDLAADAVAARFIERGLEPGDRVAWLGRNRAEHSAVLVAARRARLALLGLNWRLSRAELEYIARDAAPGLIIAEDEFRTLLPEGFDVVPVEGPGGVEHWMRDAAAKISPAPQSDDPAMLFYTSGTTGRPKGVLYSLQGLEQVLVAPNPMEFDATSVLLIVPPVFHMAGGTWTQYALLYGLQQVLLPAATPAAMLEAIERFRVTHAQWVPTLVQMALDEQRKAPRDLRSLRLIGYGAAPMPAPLLSAARQTFACRFAQAYGMTESLGALCHLPPAEHERARGADEGAPAAGFEATPATGFPDPGIELRIIDPQRGADLPRGEHGEVLARMPWPKPSYWSLPPGTSSAFDSDGWLHTGDAGYLDARGCLHLVDRINDLIITGGENVWPAEVEAVLVSLPGVAEAAVYAMPDSHWGQRVCAAIVPKPGAPADEATLISACRERLAHYKCPVRIVEVRELPRNATGKVLRRMLRERSA